MKVFLSILLTLLSYVCCYNSIYPLVIGSSLNSFHGGGYS